MPRTSDTLNGWRHDVRIGNLYGPDATFLGVPAADPDDVAQWSSSGAAIIGAPFDGGTSHRSGCRFGPQAIRVTDYLPHDGMRPSLALGVDALRDLAVVDLGRRGDALRRHRDVAATS